MPYVIGIGVPILTAISGITLPIQINQAQTMGQLQERSREAESRLKEIVSKLEKIESGVAKGFESVDKRLNGMSQRLSAADADPMRFLQAAGVVSRDLYSIVLVGDTGKAFLFPKSEYARTLLEQSGLTLQPVAPSIFAYPAPENWSGNVLPPKPAN